MWPNRSSASAEQLRLYCQQLRDMAPDATDETSRQCLLELAKEFEALANNRDLALVMDTSSSSKH